MYTARPTVALLLAVTCLSACAGRTSPATQTTPAAFLAAESDPKAIAVVDQMVEALGGQASWDKAHEITWTQVIVVDAKVSDMVQHSWDRWNGRHQFNRIDVKGSQGIVMHELYSDVGTATIVDPRGGDMPAMKEDRSRMMAEARKRWGVDSYRLVMPYKLKDPGVHLKFVEERVEPGKPQNSPPKWDVIQVTFDRGVGPAQDTYFVLIDKESHLPEIVESVPEGKKDDERSAMKWSGWVTVGGLKFATIREELGSTNESSKPTPVELPEAWKGLMDEPDMQVPSPGAFLRFLDIEIHGEPEDENYVPKVREQRGM